MVVHGSLDDGFPAMIRALEDYNYRGWISVEHDKANVGGGNYAESTFMVKWYIDYVLSKIYV
jgi:inosose dehydratase